MTAVEVFTIDEVLAARETAECMIWAGPMTTDGHPRWKNGRVRRVVYAETVAPPRGPIVMTCDGVACVNPSHMSQSDRRGGGARWRDATARFASRITEGVPFRNLGPCWQWDVVHPVTGYGTLYVEGVNQLAHRWSYATHVGPIPDGLQLDHLCRNRGCVNPWHLEPVTVRENGIRGMAARDGRDWLSGLAS